MFPAPDLSPPQTSPPRGSIRNPRPGGRHPPRSTGPREGRAQVDSGASAVHRDAAKDSFAARSGATRDPVHEGERAVCAPRVANVHAG